MSKRKYKDNIDGLKYENGSRIDKELDNFSIKLIKVVGVFAVVVGLFILIAFWFWVIRWLYQVW